jgi:uncharacterized protein YndB with AHSA1/START domain
MTPAVEPIRKSIELACADEHAFHVFTGKIALWWPLKEHSCSEENAETVEIEPRAGGRIVETAKGGEKHVWGTVLTWDPPRGVSMTWHPGNPVDQATRLTVTFTRLSPERTRVDLVHDGWEARGEKAGAVRGSYDSGWAGVLAVFKARAEQ